MMIFVPGQEVMSSDGIAIKMSLAAEYAVVDAAKALNDIDSYVQALYLTLQLRPSGGRRVPKDR